MRHREGHRSHHSGWLRAAVLGANDGIISTASLMMGIAAAQADSSAILLAGVAGLVAGAMSMAAGEYVSVRSQADTEAADLAREIHELENDVAGELRELEEIYVARGLERSLAHEVAKQLTAHDALGAHARDELGITDMFSARPLQAALTSAGTFAVGALIPLLVVLFHPAQYLSFAIVSFSLIALVLLGGLAAKVGGANTFVGAARVGFWGAAAMALTAAAGHLFGVVL
ncbi:VIT1/CCC1 transporter family protein [Cellvibrio fibrivorans]|uniref:VIT1/CCC1 family predicted Fe2+/Mn2+ transporter n=1 Tax=Cellvibrio fibrivorans TaxID=126350 RepID=A0ABU1V328_9GAMM|nr:VIT family protein [Cellvibrio fibrivorans]MDR7091854.1 VIT1/CCC1 family predicted Fe2+/Mn2+ transporter [Cellvibrio fibrivorans]